MLVENEYADNKKMSLKSQGQRLENLLKGIKKKKKENSDENIV